MPLSAPPYRIRGIEQKLYSGPAVGGNAVLAFTQILHLFSVGFLQVNKMAQVSEQQLVMQSKDEIVPLERNKRDAVKAENR